MTFVKLSPAETFLYGKQAVNDSFSYIRGIVLICISILGFVNLILGKLINKEKRNGYYYVYGALLLGLITLSLLFSDHKMVAWRGAVDRFEGYYVWIAYLMLFFITSESRLNRKELKLILILFCGSSCIVSIIGILQNVGINVLNYPLLLKLIVPVKYQAMSNEFFYLQYKFAYSTIGNPNYVGSYTALTLPLLFSLFVSETQKRYKYSYFIGFIINTWFMTVSFSEAGIIAAVFGVVLVSVSIFYLKENSDNISTLLGLITFLCSVLLFNQLNLVSFSSSKTFLFMVIIGIVAAIATGVAQTIILSKKKVITFLSLVSILCFASLLVLYTSEDVVEYNKGIHFSDIYLEENTLVMKVLDSKNNLLDLQLSNVSELSLTINNQEYYLGENDKTYHFDSDLRNLFQVTIENDDGFQKITFDNLGFRFAINDKTLYYVNSAGFLVDSIDEVEAIELFKNEEIGSKRGYIWNRTFPLLTETFFVGKGSDVYPLVFPQNDVSGKFNIEMSPYMIVDKPHNAYLQFWVSHGFVALLICTLIVGSVVLTSYKMGSDKYNEKVLEIGFRSAILGFLVVSLFNDTVVYVTPLFVVLLGLLGNKTEATI